jgi:hypothetical protein
MESYKIEDIEKPFKIYPEKEKEFIQKVQDMNLLDEEKKIQKL